MARGWRPPRKRRRSLLFENDAAHSSSTTARRSNLVDYSRDEKKTEREAKTRRREKEAEESMKGNAEGEREMRRWTREDQRWKVPLYIHTKCRSSVFQIISERRKKNVRYFIRSSCFYNLKIANVTQEIGHVFEKKQWRSIIMLLNDQKTFTLCYTFCKNWNFWIATSHMQRSDDEMLTMKKPWTALRIYRTGEILKEIGCLCKGAVEYDYLSLPSDSLGTLIT